MSASKHQHPEGIHTEGMVIHWPGFYDVLMKLITLGREDRFRQKFIAAARLERGHRVLDVGCGTGTLAIAAARTVGAEGRVHGIDPAPEMIARARAKAEKSGVPVDFQVGVIESLTMPDQSVDVVVSTLVFHHLPEHLKVAGLAEIRRVLAPGGRMLLVDFGKADGLVPSVRAAGFGTIITARLGPWFLFSLVAERGAVESP